MNVCSTFHPNPPDSLFSLDQLKQLNWILSRIWFRVAEKTMSLSKDTKITGKTCLLKTFNYPFKKKVCTMSLIKEARGWLLYKLWQCNTRITMEYECIRQEVTLVSMVNSLQARTQQQVTVSTPVWIWTSREEPPLIRRSFTSLWEACSGFCISQWKSGKRKAAMSNISEYLGL